MAADPRCRAIYQPDRMRRVLDLVHLKYLTPILSLPVIDYVVGETLHSNREPREIIAAMWKSTAISSTHDVWCMKRYLAYFGGALLRPRHALELCDHVGRLVSLIAVLKFRKHIDVSVSPRFAKMHVNRVARNSHPRRYLLSRAFLSRKLGDRRRITASHIADIIEHLDDYA